MKFEAHIYTHTYTTHKWISRNKHSSSSEKNILSRCLKLGFLYQLLKGMIIQSEGNLVTR